MAVYQFSALADGQAISFNPSSDQLNFDQTTISAAAVSIATEGANLRIGAAGKSILLSSTMFAQLASSNVTFANGSLLLAGDNNPGTASDNANNVLNGGALADQIQGLGGNDTINGGSGNDWVAGGAGNDSISGSGGQDMFVFAEFGTTNADVITDFAGNAWDSIRLDSSAFAAIGAAGRFASNDVRFWVGAAAHDADDRIIYNSTTGQLLYDADGSGPGAAQLIATLQNHAAVRADDIWVFDTTANQVINGTEGSESLNGGAGNDTINGLGGADTIAGNAGNDVIDGGAGNNWLVGGAGGDTFAFSTAPNSSTSNFITDFAPGTDRIQLDGHAFTEIGASGSFSAGDERFWASSTGTAHDATDRILYNTSNGVLSYDADGSGPGAAIVFANLQGAPALTATDFSVVNGTTGQVINGTPGDDSLTGGPGNDTINGLAGNDTLDGSDGNDTLDGGAGNDSLVGSQGADSLSGGDGNDTLDGMSIGDMGHRYGENYATYDPATNTYTFLPGDTLNGGLGDDYYYAQPNDVVVDAGGTDTIDVVEQNIVMPDGIEVLIEESSDGNDWGGITTITGNALDNVIYGTWIGNILDGGDGNDTIYAGYGDVGPTSDEHDTFHLSAGSGNYGNDYLDGQDGWDILDFADARSAFVADLTAGTLVGGGTGGSGTATLVSIEQVNGGAFNDRITGGPGSGYGSDGYGGGFQGILNGGGGNDTIIGGAASEQLSGGDGNDRITLSGGFDQATGGAGVDQFVFARSPGGSLPNTDTYYYTPSAAEIADFASGSDKIVLDAAYHSGIGAAGNFAAGDARFYAAAGATAGHDADDRVIYDTSSGYLWYDADGSGAAASQIIAHVAGGVVATDIVVERNAADQNTTGTAGNDTLVGGAGSDTLDGGAGNDSLSGLAGSDRLIGGDGNDTLDGGADADTLDGGLGNDSYVNPTDGDQIVDAAGIDTVISSETWSLFGSDVENLTIVAGSTPVPYDGVAGWGNALDNLMQSAGPAVRFDGNAGNDTLLGASATDILNGSDGNDSLNGGDGDDDLTGGGGNDTVDGGAGNDVIHLAYHTGTDQSLTDGTDVIIGGDGTDTLDYYQYQNSGSGAVVNLATGTAAGGTADAHATISGIEDVAGTAFADYITGDSGSNNLNGREGDDTLDGGAGNDVLLGGPDGWLMPASHDTFLFRSFGAANADSISDFGSGSDTFALDGSVFTQLGAAGRFSTSDDRFYAAAGASAGHDATDRVVFDTSTGKVWYDADGSGSGAAQLIATLASTFSVQPLAAGDILVTGPSTDQSLTGTAGNDSLQGGSGNDTIDGLAGDDTLSGLAGSDSLIGGVGNDFLLGGDGADTLSGGDGLDTLDGGAGTDFLYGDIGDDSIDGGGDNDRLFGGDGNDTLLGGTENDVLHGDAGNDVLNGGDGNDNLNGDAGLDQLFGGLGDDYLLGGDGDDVLAGGDGNDLMYGEAGSDWISGDAGNDQISGLQGNDTMLGGDGDDSFVINDSLSPDYGSDSIDGGAGLDRVFFDYQASAVVVDLRAGTMTGGMAGGTGSTILQNVEYVALEYWQGGFADRMIAADVNTFFSAGDGNDTLIGGAGADSLFGGLGDDVLTGGAGVDQLQGNDGADSFILNQPAGSSWDNIQDFATGTDKIHLDGSVMTALGSSGNFNASDARFFAGSAAHDADDRIIYNVNTGWLMYDADGNGSSSGALLIAALQPGQTLVATDIAVDNGTAAPSGQTINGTSGNDSLTGGAGNDTITAGAGNDTIDGGAGVDSMDGGIGNDLYFVDNAQDLTIDPENGGIDEVRSSAPSYALNDWINNLTLVGNAGAGIGNAIDNVIVGNAGNNTLDGGGGNDSLNGKAGNDVLTGGAGADSFIFDQTPGGANGDSVSDFETGVDKIRLDGSVMTALGASGNFTAGDERFYATSGQVNGHDATDRIIYSTVTNGIYYDPDGSGSAVAQLITTLQNGRTLVATDIAVDNGSAPPPPSAGQTINGTSGNDSLTGGTGNDSINGGSGNDSLAGGAGNDTLTGSGGQDSFVFGEFGAGNADAMTDFASNWDRVMLDDAAFTAIGAAGRFAAGDARFYAAAGATGGHDATDRVVYDTSTGSLYYDADGSGNGAAQIVATLSTHPTLAAGDINVI